MTLNDEVKKMLDDLLSDEASQTTLDIQDFKKKHTAWMLTQYNGFIKQFEDLFHELNVVVQLLNYVPKERWKPHNAIQYLLYPETMKTLHGAFDLLMEGLYGESVMLNRSVYEANLRLVFASCYPDDYESIFLKIPGKREFQVTNFLEQDLKLEWTFLYKIMSSIAHSKSFTHMKEWTKRMGGQQEPIMLRYALDDDYSHMCINFTTFNLVFLFHVLVVLFEEDFSAHKELADMTPRVMKIDECLIKMIAAHPNKGFSCLAADIELIGHIIKASERGKDWKKLRRK